MPQNFTLLIIDDDEDDKEMLFEVVTEMYEGVSLLKASSGAEGLQMLEKMERLPDYIFLDLNMPRMSGIQCLEFLKSNEEFRSIPVVIYTTSKSAEHEDETKKLGAAHFITKPISIKALKKELEPVFSNHCGIN